MRTPALSRARRALPWLVVALFLGARAWNVIAAQRDEDKQDTQQRRATAFKVLRAVDDAQWCWWERRGRYGATLEDLQQIVGGRIIASAQDHDLRVDLTAASNRHAYAVTITGPDAKLYLERRNGPRGLTDYGAGAGHVGERCPASQRKRGLSEVPAR